MRDRVNRPKSVYLSTRTGIPPRKSTSPQVGAGHEPSIRFVPGQRPPSGVIAGLDGQIDYLGSIHPLRTSYVTQDGVSIREEEDNVKREHKISTFNDTYEAIMYSNASIYSEQKTMQEKYIRLRVHSATLEQFYVSPHRRLPHQSHINPN